jgi:hypothetical protein
MSASALFRGGVWDVFSRDVERLLDMFREGF